GVARIAWFRYVSTRARLTFAAAIPWRWGRLDRWDTPTRLGVRRAWVRVTQTGETNGDFCFRDDDRGSSVIVHGERHDRFPKRGVFGCEDVGGLRIHHHAAERDIERRGQRHRRDHHRPVGRRLAHLRHGRAGN